MPKFYLISADYMNPHWGDDLAKNTAMHNNGRILSTFSHAIARAQELGCGVTILTQLLRDFTSNDFAEIITPKLAKVIHDGKGTFKIEGVPIKVTSHLRDAARQTDVMFAAWPTTSQLTKLATCQYIPDVFTVMYTRDDLTQFISTYRPTIL